MSNRKGGAPLACVLLCAGAMLAVDAAADDWSFEIEPYGLGANIEGDASVGRVTGAEVDVTFDDILETLEFGAMLHVEGRRADGWGFMLDYALMDLASDLSGPRGGVVDAGVRQAVLEAFVSRRFDRGDAGVVDLFAGVRWWDNDVDVIVDPALLPGTIDFELEEDWVDAVLGVRWTRSLAKRWSGFVRADVGGFGLEADRTGTLAAGVIYEFSERYRLDVHYKGLWVDYETGTRGQPGFFEYDTVTHGPVVGLNIRL